MQQKHWNLKGYVYVITLRISCGDTAQMASLGLLMVFNPDKLNDLAVLYRVQREMLTADVQQ